jgi:predicted AlkP superfamily phosphohydrolase/phosphomutase
MIRIYAKEFHPHFSVYVSPVNIDPASPVMPISQPASYSGQLARQLGSYYTQGMPYDTAALRHGVFTLDEYRAHSSEVSSQTEGLLWSALDDLKSGVLFFHFFGIDQDAHMLWGKHDAQLLETYKQVDEMVGRVRKVAGDATLIVMSDHGFARFDRAVHLNTWLMREGYLRLNDPSANESNEFFANVDWSQTKAYALGLNSVYLNLQSREQGGIVARGEEREQLLDEMRSRLLSLRDPENGNPVVLSAVTPTAHDKPDPAAPDLLVGYAPGYRASWQTALGAVPPRLIEDNLDEWRGDHCIDPSSVPGVLLANRKSSIEDPRIEDLTVTILSAFVIQPQERMKGRNLYPSRR